MKYKVTFKGGATGDKVEERVIDAAFVQVEVQMTKLISPNADAHVLLMVPNDRVISVEKIG